MNIFTKNLILAIAIVSHLPAAQAQKVALRNANVISMESEDVRPEQTILINDGRIEEMGNAKSMKVPKGYESIDVKGKYVIPGLFDMHTHFFLEQGEHVNTIEKEVNVMLANGLTTARIMAGHLEYLDAREKIKRGTWLGPQLFVVSPQFVGRWPWPAEFKNFEIINSAETATAAVKKYKEEGYDEIKLTFMVTPAAYDAVVAAASTEGIKVTGHVGPQVKLPTALKAKQQIEHMDEFIDMLLPDTSHNHGQSVSDMNIWRKKAWETVPYLDENKIPALVKQVKDAGVFVTPTNYFFFSSFARQFSEDEYKMKPDFRYIPKHLHAERWDIRDRYWNNPPPQASRDKYIAVRKKMTYELWRAGVPLMAGSDSPEWFLVQGLALHDELATFVEAGLSPYAALQTATINPARYLGIDNLTGTIREGKEADLVILNANPLTDIRNSRQIEMVISNGKVFNQEKLKAMSKVD